MARRVSDSSASSLSDTTESSTSSSSNSSHDSQSLPPIDLTPYAGKPPFSTLVELSQRCLISNPVYESVGYGVQQWLATVTVTRGGAAVRGEGLAAGKAGAKSAASAVVLAQLSGSITSPPPRPVFQPHPSDVPHHAQMQALATQATLFGAPTTLVSLDLEVFEHHHARVLEIGIASCRLDQLWARHPEITARHFIVEDFVPVRNGFFVDDKKFDFNFGVSEFVAAADIPATIRDVLTHLGRGTSVVLAGHSIGNDIRWIDSLGTGITALVSTVVDIALADKVSRQAGQVRGVESMLRAEGIMGCDLHNGGNDAVYTLELLLRFLRRLAMQTLG